MKTLAIACLVIATAADTAAHAASNVAQYTYDAAGNIVGIQRVNLAPIAISGFAPASGPIGTVVAIAGTGYSPTAARNAVTFNGVAANVIAATATTLTVAVPTGATTGKIAVTVARSTATSAQDYVVVASGVPTITGFAPAAGPSSTAVTVTGANFDTAPGATTVKLNQNPATTTSVTTTQLAFAVPAATGSGRIRITTGVGTAASAGDFVVPPGTIAAGDIIATARLVANGPAQGIGLFATGKYGVVLFDGSVGAWLSLHAGNFAVNPAGATIAYTIYKPDNTQLASGTLSAANLSVHLPALPGSGTYAMWLGTGIAQVSLDARLEANAFVPADGKTLAIARSAGQSTRTLIAAVAGEQKALMVSGLATLPAGNSLGYTIELPSGSTFRKGIAFGLGSTVQLPPFTVTGTHAVVFESGAATTQTTFKVGLLAGVVLPVDGVAVNPAIANPGEGARLIFAGLAAENLGLGVTGLALSPASITSANLSVYKPDASLFASIDCYVDGTQCASNLSSLPVTGNYSIVVQPASGATGTLQMWLSHDVAGVLASGTPFSLALARPGQNARLTFAGTAGQTLRLNWPTVAIAGAPGNAIAYINTSNGSTLGAGFLVNGVAGGVDIPALPVTGNYTVFIDPPGGATLNATFALTAR